MSRQANNNRIFTFDLNILSISVDEHILIFIHLGSLKHLLNIMRFELNGSIDLH